jgi:hypothetical protein
MNILLPFQKAGQFYKGNLHTHSTKSDGTKSPQELCEIYCNAGYHFLAITDHFLSRYSYPLTDTRPYRNENFTTLIGAELHVPQIELGEIWHILSVGLPLDFHPPQNGENGPQIAARALQAGAFVAAAHPYRYGVTENDILSLGDIHAIEIFNGATVEHNDRQDSWHLLDLLLARGKRYNACACDDAHFLPRYHDSMLGWVWVKSEALTPEALLEALKAGDYYSSTGPEIYDIQIYSGNKVYVRCSPAERIYVSGFRDQAASVGGKGITEAEIPLRYIKSQYIRVTVKAENGTRAWSNPIWLVSGPTYFA